MNHISIFNTISEDIKDTQAPARLAALLETPDELAQNSVFIAYTQLGHVGPDNDWNGLRSCALKLKWDWEFNVLFPAQALRKRA